MAKKLRVAVLMGGQSAEHQVSLKSGQMVVNSLKREKYQVKPVIIDIRGLWHLEEGYLADDAERPWEPDLKGLEPLDVGLALQRLKEDAVEVAFIAMHGPFGEDGTLQGLLEMAGIAYTGSNVLASSLAMDKVKTKELLQFHGLLTPPYKIVEEKEFRLRPNELVEELKKSPGFPLMVKVPTLGSSVGMSLLHEPDGLAQALKKAFRFEKRAIVEGYIEGREVSCGVLADPKGDGLMALPPTEIIPQKSPYFDYKAKYTPGATMEITPASLPGKLTRRVQETALATHRLLGCGSLSRTDMILKDQDIYVLELNTIPGLTAVSLLPQAARAGGIEFPELLDILIKNAIKPKRGKK